MVDLVSILVTTYKEKDSISKCLSRLIEECNGLGSEYRFEILVACPDDETINEIEKFKNKHIKINNIKNIKQTIKVFKDNGTGKPDALNLLFSKANGSILVLTDGDVYVGNGSIKSLILSFKDGSVGAVTGRPVSVNNFDMFGYWSRLLTNAGAHKMRLYRAKNKGFVLCSGYLYAMRSGIVSKLPSNVLSDDALISNMVWGSGYKIGYCPLALVFVKFPSTFSDWIKQKRRSAGGYLQIKDFIGRSDRMRGFFREVIFGFWLAITYPRNFTQMYWTILLFIGRIYLWGLIFMDRYFYRKSFLDIWKRVDSTK